MSMTPSDNWHTNNFDRIAEMVMDGSGNFNQRDFDRVEHQEFCLAYDNKCKEIDSLKEEVHELGESYADIAEELMVAKAELQQTKKTLAKAISIIQYYAQSGNWYGHNLESEDADTIHHDDLYAVGSVLVGGKKAKQFLESLKND